MYVLKTLNKLNITNYNKLGDTITTNYLNKKLTVCYYILLFLYMKFLFFNFILSSGKIFPPRSRVRLCQRECKQIVTFLDTKNNLHVSPRQLIHYPRTRVSFKKYIKNTSGRRKRIVQASVKRRTNTFRRSNSVMLKIGSETDGKKEIKDN